MLQIPAHMSPAARQQLTEPSEGKRLIAYRDCVGVLTIGYGHTSEAGVPVVTAGLRITDAQADEILSRDLAKFEKGVTALLKGAKTPVAQCEFDALVDLAFNVGLSNLRSSSLLAAYLRGDKVTAARKFMDWNKAGGREVAGLTSRRRRDQAWFVEGRLARTSVLNLLSPDTVAMPHVVDHADNWLAQWWHGRHAPRVVV